MGFRLTDIGEEWYTKTDFSTNPTVTVGLYDDSTDNIGDTDDVGTISTEPTGSVYARQSDTISTADIGGDWGFQNNNQITFDTTDSNQTVDGAFMVVNFASEDANDGGTATTHLVATAQLSQSRDLSQVDELNVSANELGVMLD